VGCAVEQGKVYTRDGRQYGVTSSQIWRGRWWNYYERGVSYTEGQFWDDAIADLQAAIKQRQDDQRRARTYGLHFTDYFPHRELGVVFYHLTRYDEAQRELETSLKSVETAKAKFYLNKVRATLLQQSGRDTMPPRVLVSSPADGLLTNRLRVEVQGNTEDDTYVAALSINGRPQFIELAEPRLSFAQEVALQDGPNTIDVTARDLLGQETRQRLTVHLDRHGPLVSLERVELVGSGAQQRARVQGYLADRSRLTRFVLADRTVSLPTAPSGSFQQEVSVGVGARALPFEAEDAAGNVTRGEIALTPSAAGGSREGKTLPLAWPRWAAFASDTVLSDAKPGLPGVAAPLRVAQQSLPAALVLTLTDLEDRQTVYTDTMYLEGKVFGMHAITQLTVAGESLWRRPSRQIFFGALVPLHQGENTLVVQATDERGNTVQRAFVIIRAVQPSRQLGARLQVTMLPFEQQGTPSTLTEAVYTSLFDALVTQERFDLVERERLEAVLRELQLSQTDLVDPSTAARTGKVVAAEGIVVGTVTETPRALTVYVRFVDVETSEVVVAEDVYGEELSLATLKTLMDGLAWKLRQHFPLVEGVVLTNEGKRLVAGLSSTQGIKPQMKLIVFRPGPEITRGRRTFTGPDTVLGEARITTVSAQQVEALLLPPGPAGVLRESDQVIIK
jgi:hypothetical protein